jgi:hypothetical protein
VKNDAIHAPFKSILKKEEEHTQKKLIDSASFNSEVENQSYEASPSKEVMTDEENKGEEEWIDSDEEDG